MIEKSRFICHVKPVSTKEEADEFIKKIKSEHKDATHNVPAMVIGEKFQIQWASDDGEPQGTSGAPIVQMLVKEEITNIALVVTRYFGGIKLGTGGLVRAYTGSAKEGVLAAGIKKIKKVLEWKVKIGYSYLSKFQSLEKSNDFELKEILYEDELTLTVVMDIENQERIKALFSTVTAGKIKTLKEIEKKC
ncbi:MAG: YigZ family protein [Anaerovoracaceae bacterium]